ncbi:MAG: lipoyl(octanoyl) transferase LipB [Alphaproteobacteria bacterium]
MTAGGSIEVSWLGRVGFEEGLRVQEELVGASSDEPERVLLLEHDPVFTTGRGGHADNRPDPSGPFGQVPVHRIGRGGDATFHGPGQLVGYVLVDLQARGGDLHRFLRSLEQGVIEVVAAFGVSGVRVPGRTGVWVGSADGPHAPTEKPGALRKIAAIGVGVRRGRTMHGFALNVSVDLDAFAAILPCGIEGVVTTSLAAEGLMPVPTVREVARVAERIVPGAIDFLFPRVGRGAEAR